MKNVVLFIALFIGLAVLVMANKHEQWQLVRKTQGITVYNRGVDSSALQESKAVMTLHTTVNSALALILDVPNINTWMSHVHSCEIIEQINDTAYYIRCVVDTPWPVSNRDIILRCTVLVDSNDKVSVQLNGVPNYSEEVTGFVRVPYFKGSFDWTKVGDKQVEVVHQVHVDPGGAIPAWLINLAAAEAPLNTMKNMRLLLEK
jgi:hypothetical protein